MNLEYPTQIKLLEVIDSVEELENILSTPYTETIEDLASIKGDIIILGAGGKIGPSLVLTAIRAINCGDLDKKVIAVSRFTRRDVAEKLRENGVEVVEADLSDEKAIENLAGIVNVISMVGVKFGTPVVICL
uniref:NmrA-like domain-containing protein n=1 Tax=Ignisphaera aggregans TaxID=334771 RepID=A0A7C5XFS7_9CREN